MPPPVPRSRPPRSPQSPKPDFASVCPSGYVATIGLQFGIGAVIGIGVAIGVPARGGRLALLLARKTAVAAAGTEIASLDAEWEFPRRGGQRTRSRAGSAQYRRPKHLSHGVLRSLRAISPAREQTGPGGPFGREVRSGISGRGTISKTGRRTVRCVGYDRRADRARRDCNRDFPHNRETAPKRWPDIAHSL